MHGLLPKSDEWDASSTSLRSWRRNSFELLRYPWRQSTLSLFSPLSWSLLGDAFLRINSPLLETADVIRPSKGPNDGKVKESLWGTQHMRSNRSTSARDAPTTLIMILLRLLEVGRRSGSRPEEGRLIRAGSCSARQTIASQLFVVQALYVCTVLSIDNMLWMLYLDTIFSYFLYPQERQPAVVKISNFFSFYFHEMYFQELFSFSASFSIFKFLHEHHSH